MLICTVSQTEHDRLSVQISQLQTKHTYVTGAQRIDTSLGEIENSANGDIHVYSRYKAATICTCTNNINTCTFIKHAHIHGIDSD